MNIISKDQYLFCVNYRIPFEGYVRDVGLVTNTKSIRTSPFPENGSTIGLTNGTEFFHTVNIQTIIPLVSLNDPGQNEALSEIIDEVAGINGSEEVASVNATMREWINKLIAEIDRRQNNNNQNITKRRTENITLEDQKKIDRNNRKITELEANNAALEQVKTEINALINSDNQSYTAIIDNSLSTKSVTGSAMIAKSQFDNNTGDFEIRIPSDCSLGLFAHELLHAYQFHIGEFSSGPIKYTFYDLHDELEAYQRGKLFGGTNPYRSIDQLAEDERYKELSRERKSANLTREINYILNSTQSEVWKDRQFKGIAERTNNAFRVNGKTYRP